MPDPEDTLLDPETPLPRGQLRMEDGLLHHGLVGDFGSDFGISFSSRLLLLFELDELGSWIQILERWVETFRRFGSDFGHLRADGGAWWQRVRVVASQ